MKRGGFVLALYEHSLGLTFTALFLLSIGIHAVGGLVEYNNDTDTAPETLSFPITDGQAAVNLDATNAAVYLGNGDTPGTGDAIIVKPQTDPILNWDLELVNGTGLLGAPEARHGSPPPPAAVGRPR